MGSDGVIIRGALSHTHTSRIMLEKRTTMCAAAIDLQNMLHLPHTRIGEINLKWAF